MGIPSKVVGNAVEHIERFLDRNPELPVILSLKHLALRTGNQHPYLRQIIERKVIPYRHFNIRKRLGGHRQISVPEYHLMQVQGWINKYILNCAQVDHSAYAFKKGSSIVGCASKHTGARWLIKIDIQDFFHSISEIQVYRVFREMGYIPLVAFELTRLCTWPFNGNQLRPPNWCNQKIARKSFPYGGGKIGCLPQGAPTSPALSNAVMRETDRELKIIADKSNLRYTRYSDDIVFSRRGDMTRNEAVEIIADASRTLQAQGLVVNRKKTAIIPPGARKIVLGLIVNGSTPRLPRAFHDLLRQHLYYLEKFGPVEHMKRRKFKSVLGLRLHVRGLIAFAHMVEPTYADETLARFNSIEWPL